MARKKTPTPASRKRTPSPRYSDDEKTAALETVIACGGNIHEAARVLGMNHVTLNAWHNGVNVSDSIHKDYKQNARARVVERLETIHASKDEVLSLLAQHLRVDMADLSDCFKENGQIDLKAAKQFGISRSIKKLKHRARPERSADGKSIEYAYTTEVELHDPQGAAQKLIGVYGMTKQPDDNPDKLKRLEALRRAAGRKHMELVGEKGWTIERANQLIAETYPEVSPLIQ